MISENKQKILDFFAQGRKHYKLMQFGEAKKCFELALKIDPKDGPSLVYRKRCIILMENPPKDDWDGVWVMKTK